MDRIATAKIEISKNSLLLLVQAYVPTACSSEIESDQFYEELSKVITENCTSKTNITIIGDFNSQIGIGKPEESPTKKRNERGWKLLRFRQEHELKIVNNHFKKRKERLWTWIILNHSFKS